MIAWVTLSLRGLYKIILRAPTQFYFFFFFLDTIPDAIATNCNKCNEKQKERAKKVINYLIENRKDDWEKLVQKYDPKGEFKKRYEAQGKKI